MIDFNSKASKYFTWRELLYLPQWDICHNPSEIEKTNLLKLAKKMDEIREIVARPIHVHCTIRPTLNSPGNRFHGQDYNAQVGGAKNSAHKLGLAMDWDCGEKCDDVRKKLEGLLETLKIRMERNPGSTWIHIDLNPPKPNRYF